LYLFINLALLWFMKLFNAMSFGDKSKWNAPVNDIVFRFDQFWAVKNFGRCVSAACRRLARCLFLATNFTLEGVAEGISPRFTVFSSFQRPVQADTPEDCSESRAGAWPHPARSATG
jgi:hypothetical protein